MTTRERRPPPNDVSGRPKHMRRSNALSVETISDTESDEDLPHWFVVPLDTENPRYHAGVDFGTSKTRVYLTSMDEPEEIAIEWTDDSNTDRKQDHIPTVVRYKNTRLSGDDPAVRCGWDALQHETGFHPMIQDLKLASSQNPAHDTARETLLADIAIYNNGKTLSSQIDEDRPIIDYLRHVFNSAYAQLRSKKPGASIVSWTMGVPESADLKWQLKLQRHVRVPNLNVQTEGSAVAVSCVKSGLVQVRIRKIQLGYS